MNISAVDLVVIVIMLLFALFGLRRGLTRKFVSVLGWVGAAMAALWGFQPFGMWLQAYLSPPWFANIAAALIIFIITLSLVLSIGHRIATSLHGTAVGVLDRGLGLLFGLAQGLVLVALLYLGYLWTSPAPENRPNWISQARLLPVVESVSLLLWQGVVKVSTLEEIWPDLRFDPSILPELEEEPPPTEEPPTEETAAEEQNDG